MYPVVIADQLTVTSALVEDVETVCVDELKFGVQDIAKAFTVPRQRTAIKIRMLIRIDLLTVPGIINPFSADIFRTPVFVERTGTL